MTSPPDSTAMRMSPPEPNCELTAMELTSLMDITPWLGVPAVRPTIRFTLAPLTFVDEPSMDLDSSPACREKPLRATLPANAAADTSPAMLAEAVDIWPPKVTLAPTACTCPDCRSPLVNTLPVVTSPNGASKLTLPPCVEAR